MTGSKKDTQQPMASVYNEEINVNDKMKNMTEENIGYMLINEGRRMEGCDGRMDEEKETNDSAGVFVVTGDSNNMRKYTDESICEVSSTNGSDSTKKCQHESRHVNFEESPTYKWRSLTGTNKPNNGMCTGEPNKGIKCHYESIDSVECYDDSIHGLMYKGDSSNGGMFHLEPRSLSAPTHEYKPCKIFASEHVSTDGYNAGGFKDADASSFANYHECVYYQSLAHESMHVIPLLGAIYSAISQVITNFKTSCGTLERIQNMISWYKQFMDEHKRFACIDSSSMDAESVPLENSESNMDCAMEILRNMETCTSMSDYTNLLQGPKDYAQVEELAFRTPEVRSPEPTVPVECIEFSNCLYSVESPRESRMPTLEITPKEDVQGNAKYSLTAPVYAHEIDGRDALSYTHEINGRDALSYAHQDKTSEGIYEIDTRSLETPHVFAPTYTFPLASRVTCNCLLKVVVNHAVAGLYIGKNGAHLKMLQEKYKFRLTQSGRGIRGDFTGVGYPCHRTNTTLLFDGPLVHILYALRPLYRIIQDDLLALDPESTRILNGHVLRVKFELNLVVPVDRKRVLLQNAGKRCMQLRNSSGVDIIAGKQNFELGNIRESIVTLLGFDDAVERACEWLCIFIQDSDAISSGDYMFMEYPKYTLAVPEH